ncbi:MAG: hypothetical protein ACXWWU_03690 [Candidatus Limnocylindria bacterium]
MPRPDRIGQALDSLAGESSRRGFLARVGSGLLAATVGGVVAKAVQPGEADAFHFCGHTYTTGSCIHPLGLPRLDSRGYPIRPDDGRPVDNIGRLVNDKGQPVHEHGGLLRDPDGQPLPPAPRTKVCTETARTYGFEAHLQGAWYRCCGGTVRKLWDCCAHHDRRINGDDALHGYCYGGRKVFCVTYYQTHVPC